MLEWRIYYGDGTTFDNLNGCPSSCSSVNVQAIIVKDGDDRSSVWFGRDWYVFIDGGWIALKDTSSLFDYILNDLLSMEAVKQGRTIPDENYKEIFNSVMNDKDFLNIRQAKKTVED